VRTVRIHDTRSGELQVLTPREGRKVGIYACGPTVYSRIHVGNARPFVVFSQLARFLAHEGYEPTSPTSTTRSTPPLPPRARRRPRSRRR
jgi:cysteinyl-tRNA synthetase